LVHPWSSSFVVDVVVVVGVVVVVHPWCLDGLG